MAETRRRVRRGHEFADRGQRPVKRVNRDVGGNEQSSRRCPFEMRTRTRVADTHQKGLPCTVEDFVCSLESEPAVERE